MKKVSDLSTIHHSRTQNSIMNMVTGLGGQLLNLILQFAVRTVFIQTLGKSYLGINGVFSNILTMLSLAELGIGSAILYKLYEPIAAGDQRRVTSLIRFYRTVYRYIGLTVAVLGCLLIPFLPYLAKDYDKLARLNINAVVIYLLYLARSVSSYFFFAYKSGIIKANQKEYIINVIKYFGTILSSIVQIVLLKLFNNFTLYVFVLLFTVIGENIIIGICANRMYPYILDRSVEKVDRKEIREIFRDCGALLLFNLNKVVLKATDNLVLSSLIGFDIVALYSNYYIFYTTIDTIFTRTFGALTHSLGNLHVEHDTGHEYHIFKVINLFTAIMGATAGIGVLAVADEFVSNWIGHDWIIPQPFAVLMGLEIYTLAVRHEFTRYRNSMGLFQQAKYRPLAGMIINLIASIILVKYWGICGVLVGTIASDWLTMIWFDPIIIHKYGFREKALIKGYFLRFSRYTVITAAIAALVYFFCRTIFIGHGWFSVVFHALFCAVTVPGLMLLLSCRSEEGRYALRFLRKQLKTVKKKLKLG